jgi:ligand-binding SRPBCC domain-containing protein
VRILCLRYRQRLPVSLDAAWSFFSNPANLAAITPPWLDFRVTSEIPPEIYPGMIVTYRIRPLPGVCLSWVSEITHLEKPRFFIDEQRFGPYRFWHHQHHFSAVQGGVEIFDLVHYALPFSPLGNFFQPWMVGPRLEKIFSFRRQALEERFGAFNP